MNTPIVSVRDTVSFCLAYANDWSKWRRRKTHIHLQQKEPKLAFDIHLMPVKWLFKEEKEEEEQNIVVVSFKSILLKSQSVDIKINK